MTSPNTKTPVFQDYINTYVQKYPRFVVKYKSKSRHGYNQWKSYHTIKTSKRVKRIIPLTDSLIKRHLAGDIQIGVLGRWYSEYCTIDIDDAPSINYINHEIRLPFGLINSNSLLFKSEHTDSYHLLFRPIYNKKPPTLSLLNTIMKIHCDSKGIELYPQAKKCIRLPFSIIQQCIDYSELEGWEDKFEEFQKLNPFEISGMPNLYYSKPQTIEKIGYVSTYTEGQELFQHGLQIPGTRHDSQFKVLYYLWRKNTILSTAIDLTWEWIYKNHHDLSKEIKTHPQIVKKEIIRQANHIWDKYDRNYVYPDSTNKSHYGYITKADIGDIFRYGKGSLPKSRFLYELVKYMYPRRMRDKIHVHSNLLKNWSSSSSGSSIESIPIYLKRIHELEIQNLIIRGKSYEVDVRAKDIKLNWNYRNSDKAILIDERAPISLEDTIKVCMDREEIRQILKDSGMESWMIRHTLCQIFDSKAVISATHI